MTTTLTYWDFRNWFKESDSYKNNFSDEGLSILFDYLEELEESTGESIEFDPIAICVEYTEYKNFKELQSNYNDIENMEELEDKTTIIKVPDSDRFIIQNF